MRRAVFLLVVLLILPLRLAAAPFDPFAAIGLSSSGNPIPSAASFKDETGGTIRLDTLLGQRPLIVAPVYYTCPNTCGTTLAWLFGNLAELNQRPGRDYDLVVFSIDPRETPADARNARGKAQPKDFPTGGVHFLVGSEPDIEALTKALGFRYAWDDDAQQYAHTVGIAVVTPAGYVSRWLYGFSYRTGELSAALAEARGAPANISFGQQLLVLCHVYNPLTGRYSTAVWIALRLGGISTIVGLIALVMVARRRTKKALP